MTGSDDNGMPDESDFLVQAAVRKIRSHTVEIICKVCGIAREGNHFSSIDPDQRCRQCAATCPPTEIRYKGAKLKSVPGQSITRLLGIHQNMWLDSSAQRRKVIDGAIEVAAYLHKNEDLRIDQVLKVISMCLPSLLLFSAPLIRWPEADFKTLTAIQLRAYKNA